MNDSNLRFHSINVPSEWGREQGLKSFAVQVVSIQLMSPASGDLPRTMPAVQPWRGR